MYDLDGDGVAEVVVAGHARIMVLDGRTGQRKLDPFWTFNFSYNDVSALMLIDMNNDGHVDIVQNASFIFNCATSGAAVGVRMAWSDPIALSGGGSNHWLPGPKTFPNVQYRSTAIDDNARVLHDTKVSRVFRAPEQQGSVRDPRLAQATSFTYEAGDGASVSAAAQVIITIAPDNKPPVFTSTPPKSLLQAFAPTPPGGLVTHFYDVAAFDPDPGDTIAYSLKSAPILGDDERSGPYPLRAHLRQLRVPVSVGLDDGDRDRDRLARCQHRARRAIRGEAHRARRSPAMRCPHARVPANGESCAEAHGGRSARTAGAA